MILCKKSVLGRGVAPAKAQWQKRGEEDPAPIWVFHALLGLDAATTSLQNTPKLLHPTTFPHLRSWQFFCRNLRVTLHPHLPLRPHIHPRAVPLVSTSRLYQSPGHRSLGLTNSHLDHHWSPNETSRLTLPFVPPPCPLSPWKARCLTLVGRRCLAVPLCWGAAQGYGSEEGLLGLLGVHGQTDLTALSLSFPAITSDG